MRPPSDAFDDLRNRLRPVGWVGLALLVGVAAFGSGVERVVCGLGALAVACSLGLRGTRDPDRLFRDVGSD